MRIAATPIATTSLQCATTFGPILDGLAGRLGSAWYLEATRACDGGSILLVMAADDEADLTLMVTETSTGYLLQEMKADRLRRVDECPALDQVPSLVTRHIFQAPARIGFAFTVHSAAA